MQIIGVELNKVIMKLQHLSNIYPLILFLLEMTKFIGYLIGKIRMNFKLQIVHQLILDSLQELHFLQARNVVNKMVVKDGDRLT